MTDATRQAVRATAGGAAEAAAGATAGSTTGAATGRMETVPAHRVRFDTAQLKSSYCNVCNGTSTREEVVLNFGVNSNWDQASAERLDVALLHRIVLSPQAAKRVRDMMIQLIDEHEARHGKLDR